MSSILINTNNYSGKNSTITFYPQTGGTVNIGSVTLPYTYTADYVYGIYVMYFPEYGTNCTLIFNVPAPPNDLYYLIIPNNDFYYELLYQSPIINDLTYNIIPNQDLYYNILYPTPIINDLTYVLIPNNDIEFVMLNYCDIGGTYTLVTLPYEPPSIGKIIFPGFTIGFPQGITNPNTFDVDGVYWNTFDNSGINQFDYFSGLTNPFIIYFRQGNNIAIYSGGTNSINYAIAPFPPFYGVFYHDNSTSGTTELTLLQASPNDFISGESICIYYENLPTPTPSPTPYPTPTPTPIVYQFEATYDAVQPCIASGGGVNLSIYSYEQTLYNGAVVYLNPNLTQFPSPGTYCFVCPNINNANAFIIDSSGTITGTYACP